ncbi:MAG TPA: DUF4097 family beta strand repeat-containing protein [Pyrinomonadaceae bacterium]|nr:DUF4097 family beta strand repeat-containing protein [Pyrinomonadaceae bacterium]
MFKKLLIAVVLLTIALVTYGATAAIATGQDGLHQTIQQEVRPVPQVPNAESSGGEQPGQQVTEEFHQTYPLSATGRVNLENINGGVKITVWDRAAVQVDAIKKAYRRDRLAEAQIEVTSTEENIRIKTEYPERNQTWNDKRHDNPAIVEYSLTVPRKAILESIELINGPLDIEGVEGNVKASSVNGPVTARGLMGEARLTTVNGPLRATFTELNEARPISLGSVNGDVTVVIPSNANASVRAGTVHGLITNDWGVQVKHGEYVGHSLDAQIGNGGPRVKLSNVNGAISITRAQDGRALSPVTSIARVDKVTDEMMAEDLARDIEMTTAELTLKKMETARIVRESRQVQREAARQVNAEMRKAQREIEQVQREIQRQQRLHIRPPRVIINRNRTDNSNWDKFTNQETKSFAVSGSPRVNITTFDGPVTVRGWDQAQVRYTATKRAGDEESLKQISIETEQQGQTISINAKNENAYSGSVTLEVHVPRNSSLHVTSGDGPLTLDGVSGDITLRSGDGPISVNNSGGQLHVNTGDGPIQINKFDGQVDARTGDGPIALDGNFNALNARTGDGQISLTVPAGSSFTIETNATEGIANEGFDVAEDVTLSPRVKRWRVGNGGQVFVLRTGEGKVLLRPRN